MRCIILVCALLALLPSCAPVPLPQHGLLWGRGSLGDRDLQSLKTGETRREEVLLLFGPPAIALEKERILIYDWGLSAGYVANIFGALVEVGSDRSLVLEFDGDGRLLRFAGPAGSGWSQGLAQARGHLQAWYPDGGPWPRRWVVDTDPLPELWTRLGTPAAPGHGERVRIGEFRDGRPAGKDGRVLGTAQTAYYLGIVDIHATRPVGEMVRAAVARQLASDGFQVTDGEADAEVSGFVEYFAVEESFVKFVVVVEAISGASTPTLRRRYANTLGELVTSYDFGARARAALLDLQRQIASDGALTRFLGGGRPQ